MPLMMRALLVLATLLLAGCGGVAASPDGQTVTMPTSPSVLPAPPPPGPHFALELQAASTAATFAGEAWHGLIAIIPGAGIVRPDLPVTVTATCAAQVTTFSGFVSGTAAFSCLLPVGTHPITARAQTADGQVYAAATTATIVEKPAPTPLPPTPPDPAPRPPSPTTPIVRLQALELWKGDKEATWRFSLDVTNGTLDDAEFDFGPGSNCKDGDCTIEDEDDYIDVKYTIAGTKEIRVAATVDGETIRARNVIVVAFAP
jgi:hypothetical protein